MSQRVSRNTRLPGAPFRPSSPLEPFPPELPASPVEPGEPGNPFVKDKTIILIYITQDYLKHNLIIGLTVMIHGYFPNVWTTNCSGDACPASPRPYSRIDARHFKSTFVIFPRLTFNHSRINRSTSLSLKINGIQHCLSTQDAI